MNQLPTILAMEILGIRRRRPAEGEKAVTEKNRRTRRLQQKQQHEKNQQQQKLTVIIQPLRP